MTRSPRSPLRRSAPPALPPLLAALALLGAGCADTFVPASVVEDRRVLALVAEPPALDATVAGAAATVRAVEAQPVTPPPLPAGATLERRWSLCPFSLGASTAYACAVPQCEVPLAPDATGAVTVHPVEALQACLTSLGGALPPDLAAGGVPPSLELLVRFQLVEVTAGATPGVVVLREAVQRLPTWLDPTRPPTSPLNVNPAFAATPVLVDGVAATPCDPAGLAACTPAGSLARDVPLTVQATVDPDTIQDYLVGDRTVAESFTLSFFTTAGRFHDASASATRAQPTGAVELKHDQVPAGTADALLWVVLRDLRGGQAVTGPYRIQVAP